MSRVVFSSLKTAVKGSALLAISIAAGQVLWFFIRILIVRNVTQAELGVYSLALTAMSMAVTLADLGLYEGAARYISVSRGKDEAGRARGIIKGALEMSSASSFVFAVALFLLAGWLSEDVFKMPELSVPLKVISAAVVFTRLLNMAVGVLRGYGLLGARAVNDVANPLVYMALLALIFLLGLPFIFVIWAFVAANAVSAGGMAAYAWRKLDLGHVLSGATMALRGELLRFSLPLMGVALTGLVMTWTDTLMLGYFMRAEDVGVYSVGVSLSQVLLFGVNILGFVFMPIAGELYARRNTAELKRTYQVLTKWAFAASFPVFLVLFFFPEMTLAFLFGKQFEAASAVVRLLSVRYMAAIMIGSAGMLLMVMGRPRLQLAIASIVSVLNVALNYLFIPVYGLAGAASATLVSSSVGLAMYAAALYRMSGIHVFTSGYFKPAAASAAIAAIIYAIAKSLPLHFWMMPLYFALFVGGYLAAILLTRSIEKEDAEMFDAVMWRLGVELKPLKDIIRRFARG